MRKKHLIFSALAIWVLIAFFTTYQYHQKPFKADIAAKISGLIKNEKGVNELEKSLLEIETLKVIRTDATENFWLHSNGDRSPDFIQFSESKLFETETYLVFSTAIKPSNYRLLKHTLRGTVLIGRDNKVIAYQTYTKHDWF